MNYHIFNEGNDSSMKKEIRDSKKDNDDIYLFLHKYFITMVFITLFD